MIIACHQPNFLPWIGFFYKVFLADAMVLLDEVQFPRGFHWVNRNRLKCDQGELWLTVPVRKKGRGLQRIKEVEIYGERDWWSKRLQSIVQNYTHAPYLPDHLGFLCNLFGRPWTRLFDFNLEMLKYLKTTLGIQKDFILQSALGLEGRGTELLVSVCKRLGGDVYLAPLVSQKYLDEPVFERSSIGIHYYKFYPPVYPQLWGDFIYNLSILDLLLNCGGKSLEIIKRYNRG